MLKLDPVAVTDVGRRRNHNEDYLGDLIFKDGRKYGSDKLNARGYLFAVADGMGGHASGEVASEMAVTVMFEQYYSNASSGDVYADLLKAVHTANFQVYQAGLSNGRGQMGTTLTLALVIGNRVVVGNIGDSRTYLLRQGLPARITHDHSLVQDQIDIGALTPEQAERSSIRNVITRAVGHREEVDPDFFEQELQAGDVLLLCSDGLHGAVRETEMGTIVANSASLKEAATSLVALANERGGVDNISVMLIGVSEVGELIPPILQERAAFYPPPRSQPITQPTATMYDSPVEVLDEEDPDITLFPSNNARTAPIPPSEPLATTQKIPISASVSTARKSSFKWYMLAALLVALVAVAALIVVLLPVNNGDSVAQTNTVPTSVAVTSSLPAALPTVTLAAATPSLAIALTPAESSRATIELAQINKIQVILQSFPNESYTLIMNRLASGSNTSSSDIEFMPGSSNALAFESRGNLSLGAGSYRLTITPTRAGSAASEVINLTLKDTEASSETRVKLSQPSISTLVLTINRK